MSPPVVNPVQPSPVRGAYRAVLASLSSVLLVLACKSTPTLEGPQPSGGAVSGHQRQDERRASTSSASRRSGSSRPRANVEGPKNAKHPPKVLDSRFYGAAASSREPTKPPRRPDAGTTAKEICVVAAIGDSLTDPKSHGGKYLDVLRERAPESRFDSYGKGGEMVNQMRRRFARDVLGEPPIPGKPKYTHVIVFGGVNDLYSDLTAGRTVEKITRDLTYMYDRARGHGMKVVAITVSPWGGFGRYYNEKRGRATEVLNAWIMGQRARGKVDAVVDAYELLSCGDPIRLCPTYFAPFRDGIHFGKKGHEKLGRALYEAAFKTCR
jgi:lysophospholipase L1-like esterase